MRGRSRSSSAVRSDRAGSSRRAAGSRAGCGRVNLVAGSEPDAGHEGFTREDLLFLRRQRLWRVTALELQQMPKILIGCNSKQPSARFEAGRELEIGEIGAAIAAHEPI